MPLEAARQVREVVFFRLFPSDGNHHDAEGVATKFFRDVEGNPVFFEEYRSSQELKDIKSVLESAMLFAREYFDLFYRYLEGTISPSLIEEMYETENYPVVHYTIYDDWLRVARRKREDMENSSDGNN